MKSNQGPLRKLLFFFVSLVTALLVGCGGGGGGSGGGDVNQNPQPDPAPNDLCSALNNLERGPKIVNGTACSHLNRSPIVRLISDYSSGRPGYLTGTMITSTKVLTAGHCVTNPYVSSDRRLKTTVVFGNADESDFVNTVDVWIHPGFRLEGPYIVDDLAIVTLEHPVDLQTLPILLSTEPGVGGTVEIVGYGTTRVGTPGYVSYEALLHQPLNLQTGEMTLSGVDQIRYTADALPGKASICHGDSGGPLIFMINGKPAIIGVTSLVNANGQALHCAPGSIASWTRLQNPAVQQELLELVPNVDTE